MALLPLDTARLSAKDPESLPANAPSKTELVRRLPAHSYLRQKGVEVADAARQGGKGW